MIVNVITGFGYLTDNNGHIVGKYSDVNKGPMTIPDKYTYTEVADQNALNAIVIYQTAVDAFSVDVFVAALLDNFAGDTNVLPYYAIYRDFAIYKNFTAMKNMTNGLLAASKLTQNEVNTLNTILAAQNIILSNF